MTRQRGKGKQFKDFGGRGRSDSRGGDASDWIYGRRSVMEVLRAGKRTIHEAVLPPPDRDTEEVAAIRRCLISERIPFRVLDREALDDLCRGGNHQGVAIRTSAYPYVDIEDVLQAAEADENALVILLDHVEDPQNVGSILRTADAVGATGVIIPEDRACGVTAAVVRASAGASEHQSVVRVVNLPQTMKKLQEHGFWVTALDFGDDAKAYTSIDFKGRVALVVGAEGAGVSRLVRDTCDFIAYLPMSGEVQSLNAGVATGIALYEIIRQRT